MQLSNKTIAVVGNASALLQHEFGSSIDAHDVVIRMNRGVPLNAVSQGMRTDILAFSVFPLIKEVHLAFGAEAFIWMSPKRRHEITPEMQLPANTIFYSLERWDALNQKLGSRPSVGAMVLDLLVAQDVKAVSIFGFDFKNQEQIIKENNI